VITDGINGLHVDFFSPQEIAQRVADVLDRPDEFRELRIKARQTILERYALHKLLPVQLNLLNTIASRQ